MVSGINAEDKDRDEQALSYGANVVYVPIKDRISKTRTEFPQYIPFWDEAFHDDPTEFEYHDPALRAAKDMPNLLRAGVKVRDITPKMGTIITGLDLKGLSDATKDELALLIAQRKVVVLRDQLAFLQAGPDHQQDFMTYFGKLNIQPASGSVIGNPAFHIVYRDDNEEIDVYLRRKTTTTGWHQDVSYERQPPGYVMLGILACPDVGGDTIFADTNEAYRRLSPAFQNMINGLTAVHSSKKLINHVRSIGGFVRRNPVTSVHPIVRVHPITGERSIWVNSEFVTGIVGFKEEESDLILKWLVDHVVRGHDFQARIQWERHSVVMFDGRSTLHTATVDYDSRLQARHMFRLASMTEKPIAVKPE